MFTNARNFQISGSGFHSHNTHHHSGQTGIDVLREASVSAAAVDAEAREHAPRCFPGTREQHISDITDWATGINNGQAQRLLWMWGPAGVGKSAIAQTCAERVQELGHLGAAFFFSINGRTDHRRFFVTLAYQLSTVLPDYRQILDTIVNNDKTIIAKTMSSQFDLLIVKPLKELERQGASVRQKAIFIDGLDECANADAQAKIIQLIGASVHKESTPFRWAIFSRAEIHILSAVEGEDISPITRIIELPIRSLDDDHEIELYLRHEFRNILRRRKLPLSPSWPAEEDIKALVKAAAGLFAYAAAVLRFIDLSTTLRLEEPLRAVLDSTFQEGSGPFASLDAFYMLIMERIPKGLLPAAKFILCHIMTLVSEEANQDSDLIRICNCHGLTQSNFLGIYQYLHAVLKFRESKGPLILNNDIDSARSYFDQDQSFQPPHSLMKQMTRVHGGIGFYHKSFYDFLRDPARSLSFCIITPAMQEKWLDRLVQRHLYLAQRYVIQGTKLVLAPGVECSAATHSWPHGTEFVDSHLMLWNFFFASTLLSQDGLFSLRWFMTDIGRSSWQKLSELDYRKYFAASRMWAGNAALLKNMTMICGTTGSQRTIDVASFQCLDSDAFMDFEPEDFLQVVKRYEDLKVVKPYHPRLPSALASIPHAFSRRKPSGKSSGLYKLGHGEKSVIWFWEFDTDAQYFHQFRTVNLHEAMKIYEKSKFEMWDESWEPPS